LGGLLVFESLAPDPDLQFAPPDLAVPQLSVEVVQPSPASEPAPATALPPAALTVVAALALIQDAPPASTALELETAEALMQPAVAEAAMPSAAAEASAAAEPTTEPTGDYTVPPQTLYAGMPQLRGLGFNPVNPPYAAPAVRSAQSNGPVEAAEPETLGLLGIALLALAARRRRT
jgi:hypothetical protein